jgi:hypothetical protein
MSNLQFFISCFLLVCVSAQAQPCVAVPKGLSAWFNFEDVSKLSAPGKVGKSIHLDGLTQFLELPASTKGISVGSENFTIELWVRTASHIPARPLVDKRDTQPAGYLLFVQYGRIGLQVSQGSDRSDTIAQSNPINDNRWHHVAAVAKRLPPQPARIYIDGKLSSGKGKSLSIESLDNNIPLWLGRHHPNALVNRDNIYFTGDLDELSFYRRDLSEVEIMSIYRAGASGKCRPHK